MKSSQAVPVILTLLLTWNNPAIAEQAPAKDSETKRRLLRSPEMLKTPGPAGSALPFLDGTPYYKMDQQLTAAKKKKKKRKRKKKKQQQEEGNALVYILPAGAGQFYNGSMMMGLLFGLAQAGGIGFTLLSYSNANAKVDETNAYIDQRNAEFDALTSTTEKQAHQDETNRVVADFDAEAEGMVSQANLGLALFAVSYLASVVEAFISGPSSPEPPKKRNKKKKRKKRKKKKAFLPHESGEELTTDYDAETWKGRNPSPRLHWNVMPYNGSLVKADKRNGSLALNIQYKF